MTTQTEAIESLLAEYDMINSAFAKDLREALAEQPARTAPACFNGLVDTDGENKAVRCLLMLYGERGLTVGAMKKHLSMSGFKMWPDWVEREPDGAHLTKSGAQLWIRHLFSLEQPAQQEPVAWTDEQLQMLNFLYGAGEFDGVWFDQKHPTEKGAFWWRKHLRRLFDSPQPPAQQEPSPDGVLFAVEEAIRNGDCPWQIEQAFDDYEAERKAHYGITKGGAG